MHEERQAVILLHVLVVTIITSIDHIFVSLDWLLTVGQWIYVTKYLYYELWLLVCC